MKTQTDTDRFILSLRNKGMKATPQRLAVHDAMTALGHANADMVSEWIRKNSGTKVTVASVYNILTQLSESGIYRLRCNTGKKMLFDVNTSKHIHLHDISTNEYKDFIDEDVTTFLEQHFKRKKFKGYKLEDIDVQLNFKPTARKNKQI